MAKADIAVLLALGAAFFIAIGDVIHQRSALEVTDEPVGHLQLFTRLLRDGRWWLGTAVAAAGFGLQAAALALGSVLLVQALLVTSLLFALPISARLAHRRVTRWQGLWAVLLAGSVVVIVTVGNPTAGQTRASVETWLAVCAVLGPLLALFLVGARMSSGSTSAVLLGGVSGTLWGVFAVLTKSVVHRLDVTSWAGALELMRTPELYAWAVVAVAGQGHPGGGGRRAGHAGHSPPDRSRPSVIRFDHRSMPWGSGGDEAVGDQADHAGDRRVGRLGGAPVLVP